MSTNKSTQYTIPPELIAQFGTDTVRDHMARSLGRPPSSDELLAAVKMKDAYAFPKDIFYAYEHAQHYLSQDRRLALGLDSNKQYFVRIQPPADNSAGIFPPNELRQRLSSIYEQYVEYNIPKAGPYGSHVVHRSWGMLSLVAKAVNKALKLTCSGQFGAPTPYIRN
jgi:hypothetical protein